MDLQRSRNKAAMTSIPGLIHKLLLISAVCLRLINGIELSSLSTCTCFGHEVIYECAVSGSGATSWEGTALESCSRSTILLRHSEFNNSNYGINTTCGTSEHIYSRAVSSDNGVYTSQLILNVSNDTVGDSIECSGHGDSEEGAESLQITLSREPPPPPVNVRLSELRNGNLTFTWEHPATNNCKALHYYIKTNGCGECQQTTVSTNATCRMIQKISEPQTCSFTVRAVVCGTIVGNYGDAIEFEIKAPEKPKVYIIPEYSGESSKLIKLSTKLELSGETHSVNDTDSTYTINYTDPSSGRTCGSSINSLSTCNNGTCTDVFNVATSSCPSAAFITVSSLFTNSFGNGLSSEDIIISTFNHIVDIIFDFGKTKNVQCTFLYGISGEHKHCAIQYGPVSYSQDTDKLQFISKNSTLGSDTVNIELHNINTSEPTHSYRLTASDNTSTVSVVGTFTTCNPDKLTNEIVDVEDNHCGASYSILGMKGGFVCYSGLNVGSTAVYYCLDCGYNSVIKSSGTVIRTCSSNGQWNGTVPHCHCGLFTFPNVGLLIGTTGGIMMLCVTFIIFTFIIVIIMMCRAKAKLKRKLQQSKDAECKIYEEIAPLGQKDMNTSSNVAYASCRNILHSTSCAY